MTMRVLTLAIAGWASLVGCDDPARTCYPGDFIPCTCEDEREGYAQCDAEGIDYGECAFCGTTPGLGPAEGEGGAGGGVGGAGGEGGAPLLPFMSECEHDEECETGLCFNFPAKGSHCSQSCDGPEDCPLPSTGCNGMGICKAP